MNAFPVIWRVVEYAQCHEAQRRHIRIVNMALKQEKKATAEIWTRDLMITSHALLIALGYQLSYCGLERKGRFRYLLSKVNLVSLNNRITFLEVF